MYQDRTEAGSQLAEILTNHNYGQIIILAIPRGGIVVAAPIAQRLEVPINVLITKKIGHPAHAEIAIGAVMPDGSAIIDAEAQNIFDEEYISQATIKAYQEIKRRLSVYQATETLPQLAGKTAIIIDDGIATGHTVKAAIKWLRTLKPAKVILA
ncbi:MAG: phosphoribosyltransferase, partial [Firmicutes bacterium]|nr:phosphoribosyltransferase [Bacillota bacterium]